MRKDGLPDAGKNISYEMIHSSNRFVFWSEWLPGQHCSGVEPLEQEGQVHCRLRSRRLQAHAVRGGSQRRETHHFEAWRGVDRKARAFSRGLQLLQRPARSPEGPSRIMMMMNGGDLSTDSRINVQRYHSDLYFFLWKIRCLWLEMTKYYFRHIESWILNNGIIYRHKWKELFYYF